MSGHKRHEEHEEHMDESWLVPYADVLTLLLALFIVLFAMSKIDQEKFDKVAESLKGILGGGMGVLDGQISVQPLPTPPQIDGRDDSSGMEANDYGTESAQLNNLKSNIDGFIAENKLNAQIQTKITDEGLVIQIRDGLLFKSASADILPIADDAIEHLSRLLANTSQKIEVSGHTDNLKISTKEFPSNWDLSSQRAVNFTKKLMSYEPRLKPDRFSAVGYAEYQPVAVNITEEGRAKNRRIEILVKRLYKKP